MSRYSGVPARNRESRGKFVTAQTEVTARPSPAERIKNKINKERRAARKRAEEYRLRMASRHPAPAVP